MVSNTLNEYHTQLSTKHKCIICAAIAVAQDGGRIHHRDSTRFHKKDIDDPHRRMQSDFEEAIAHHIGLLEHVVQAGHT